MLIVLQIYRMDYRDVICIQQIIRSMKIWHIALNQNKSYPVTVKIYKSATYV